jgi:archaellum biogenesis protein FlaJ (TadC family)
MFAEYTLIGLVSLLVFVVSLLSLPCLVAQIPEDYFAASKRRKAPWAGHNPIVRVVIIIGKNLLGVILLLGGFIMLFMPGQGILTMVAGLVLMDYPGKFAVEKKIATNASVLKGLNWLRAKAKKPPLKL